MTVTYRKWGQTVRSENGVTAYVDEAGEAIESDGLFHAQPITRESRNVLDQVAADDVQETARRINQLASLGNIERIIITAGHARHETASRMWEEQLRRVHVSLVEPPLRALIDLASFDVDDVGVIAAALRRAHSSRPAPPRLRLAPAVAAAALPALIGELAMEQQGGGLDGRGAPVQTRVVTGEPPNWFRPSYAVRPVRAWMNLRALPFGTIDLSAPRAIALLAPPDGTRFHVLCIDSDDAFTSFVNVSHITAVSPDAPQLFPFAAGSFGTEMML